MKLPLIDLQFEDKLELLQIKDKYKYQSFHLGVNTPSQILSSLKQKKKINKDIKQCHSLIQEFKFPQLKPKRQIDNNSYFSHLKILKKIIIDRIHQQQTKKSFLSLKNLINSTQDQVIYLNIIDFRKNGYEQLICNVCKTLYYTLSARIQLSLRNYQQTLQDYHFCQYYTFKEELYACTIDYLWKQTQVYLRTSQYQNGLNCLRNALQLSIIIKDKQAELRILQQISIFYYYLGNSQMGLYYYKKSHIGMSKNESQIYRRQFDKNQQIKQYEYKIFKIPYQKIRKRKNNQIFQINIYRQSLESSWIRINQQKQIAKQMVQNINMNKYGKILQKMNRKNQQLAKIKISKHAKPLYQNKFKQNQNLQPLEHCTQIIKSHLSKGRAKYFKCIETQWKQIIILIQQIINEIKN